jgi:tetratricopeptide (TPR) repeat protein
MGDVDQAIESGQSALALAEQMGDLPLAIVANERLGPAYAAAGDYRKGAAVLKETVRALGNHPVDEVMGTAGLLSVFSRIYLLCCLIELGEFDEAAAHGDQAIKIAEAVDHVYSRLFAYYGVGTLALFRGDVDSAIPLLEQGFTGCEAAHVPLMLPLLGASLGAAYALAARQGEAIALLERTVRDGIAMQRMGGHSILVVRLGEAYLRAGRPTDALDAAERAVRLAREHKERGHEAYALRLLGDIASQGDPLDAANAELVYEQASALSERLGMRPLQAHCRLGLGRLLLRTGRREAARGSLLVAEASFRALGMPYWCRQAREGLASLA